MRRPSTVLSLALKLLSVDELMIWMERDKVVAAEAKEQVTKKVMCVSKRALVSRMHKNGNMKMSKTSWCKKMMELLISRLCHWPLHVMLTLSGMEALKKHRDRSKTATPDQYQLKRRIIMELIPNTKKLANASQAVLQPYWLSMKRKRRCCNGKQVSRRAVALDLRRAN